MLQVFVETNWVVEVAAPEPFRDSFALELLDRASRAEIEPHVPAICFLEARRPLRERFLRHSDYIRKFIWSSQGGLNAGDTAAAYRILDKFDSSIRNWNASIDSSLQSLRSRVGLDVFALDDRMLSQSIDLSLRGIELKPSDQTILAGILELASRLDGLGQDHVFCEMDSDLQPWTKDGKRREPLAGLYESARVRVEPTFDCL